MEGKVISSEVASSYSSLFSNKWPQIASKLLKICSSSKINEAKEFYNKNKVLIDSGNIYSPSKCKYTSKNTF